MTLEQREKHNAYMRLYTKRMTPEQKRMRAESQRRYVKNNPDRVKQTQDNYRQGHAVKIAADRKKRKQRRRDADPLLYREKINRYRRENLELAAKVLIVRAIGGSYRDIPAELVEAKAAYLLAFRAVRARKKTLLAQPDEVCQALP